MLVPSIWSRSAAAQEEVEPIVARAVRPFVDPLAIPPIITASQLASGGLSMTSAHHQFHRDLGDSATFAYQSPSGASTYLGPIVIARRGTPVTWTARNELGPHPLGVDTELHGPDHANDAQSPRASVHMHGNYVSPESDGAPDDTFLPGESHTYHYLNDQQSGNLWFHDHALGITRLNVYAGLAGGYLIRDAVEDSLGLPSGEFEVPLIIQDKAFLPRTAGGAQPLYYPNPWEPEFFGNMAVVNGTVWPSHDVKAGMYRFRVYNGSSSRFWNLTLRPVVPMWQIGTDTGLVRKPVGIDSIVLAPGERADLLVDFSRLLPGSMIKLRNGRLPRETESPAEPRIADIMRFRVVAGAADSFTVPTTIPVPIAPTTSPGVPRRTVLLTEVIDPETDDPVMALLNARPWETDEIERPTVDTLEQWEIVNLTADTHPIHLHLVQFQLVGRQPIDVDGYLQDVFGTTELHPDDVGTGNRPFPSASGYTTGARTPPKATERGWKDSIQAHPGMVTRILVPFGPNAADGVPFGENVTTPFTGRYVWHCHILDHEDNEMMLPYEVVPAT
jgi:FtsP/CotA-like multicopper oxidase with cupredoxin domain